MNPNCRLPLIHPEYQYPATRNPYYTRIQGLPAGQARADNQAEAFCGQIRAQFQDSGATNRPLHVEIGCSGGHVILEWAARNPGAAYVGIDWKYKQVFKGAEKAQKRGIHNVIFFRSYAERMPYIFGPSEIDHLYLFFPDPWPKKSQWKNRYITAGSLKQLAGVVKTGGTFEIKTDHLGYFKWIEEAISKSQQDWTVFEISRDLHADHPNPRSLGFPEVTLFESLFIRDGVKINRVKLQKN